MEQETETQKNKSKLLETAYSENRGGRVSSQLDEDVHSRGKLQAERSEEVYGFNLEELHPMTTKVRSIQWLIPRDVDEVSPGPPQSSLFLVFAIERV